MPRLAGISESGFLGNVHIHLTISMQQQQLPHYIYMPGLAGMTKCPLF